MKEGDKMMTQKEKTMPPSEKIKICLDMKNLKRKDLAEAAKMPASTISDFLNGKTTKLDITKAQSIANTLGCTLDYLVGDDTMGIDISTALKAEREEHGESTDEVSKYTKIPEAIILKYESGDEPVSFFLFEKLCQHYGLSTWEFLQKYDFYDEYIPPQFNGDADAYEAFKKAEREDAMKDKASYPELRDIIEKGWYVVDGLPARRSFKLRILPMVEASYYNKYGVFSYSEDDPLGVEGAREMVEVCKLLVKNNKQVQQLNEIIRQINASPLDGRVDIIYPFYASLRDSVSQEHESPAELPDKIPEMDDIPDEILDEIAVQCAEEEEEHIKAYKQKIAKNPIEDIKEY